ncbi:hypothetical protein GS610_08120 [Ruegeria sp. HKCCD6228]|uniref:hypothetical protein n=1 Tax=Ruegeria sp. HKCCD6228 TaxID=2683001 RepID=UPI0014931454|nr:hypothetical protein [Ruegeria sp. HKCCD6228]NOD97173.1 hypothetical protein [Ruegeria sp. HKCCD6228]
MARFENDFLFERVNDAALPAVTAILDRLGVEYRRRGAEIEMLNPIRADERFGSFLLNTRTGRWSEFATGDKGGDVISLVAYLRGCKQIEAAKGLASMLGVTVNG